MGGTPKDDEAAVTDRDIVQFGGFTVTDYNGSLIIRCESAEIRIGPTRGDKMVITPGPGLTFEPGSVNGVPAFRTRKCS
jgi:hypothetical protein